MKTTLDIVGAWVALDVVLIAIWHLAHVRFRRFGARVVGSATATQRVYTVAPEFRQPDTRPTLARVGRG